jgi:hypothetical protein
MTPLYQITRSAGLPTGYPGFVAGGGYSGHSEELDAIVQVGARLLVDHYRRDITIRFNSDRRSGGAWLVTHPMDNFAGNAEIGICAGCYPDHDRAAALSRALAADAIDWDTFDAAHKELPRTLQVFAHIGNRSHRDPRTATARIDEPAHCYTHAFVADPAAALDYLKAHAILRRRY